jgi:hypothetical protein
MRPAYLLIVALLIPPVCTKAQTREGDIISLDDEYNAKRSVTPVDVQIAQRAKQIIDRPEKWDRADTRVCRVKACNSGCLASAKTFSLYCALERATKELTGGFEHRGSVM